MDLDITWMQYDRRLGCTSSVGAEALRAHLVRRFLPNVHSFELVSPDDRLLGQQDYTVENCVVLQEALLVWAGQHRSRSTLWRELAEQARQTVIVHRGGPLRLCHWDTVDWTDFVDCCRTVMVALLQPPALRQSLTTLTPLTRNHSTKKTHPLSFTALDAVLGAVGHARHTLQWRGTNMPCEDACTEVRCCSTRCHQVCFAALRTPPTCDAMQKRAQRDVVLSVVRGMRGRTPPNIFLFDDRFGGHPDGMLFTEELLSGQLVGPKQPLPDTGRAQCGRTPYFHRKF